MVRWRVLLTLIALLSVAVFVRCWRLGYPFVFSDESFSWRVSRCATPELLRRAADDTHPPGHFLLLKAWMRLFGDSPSAIRGLSATAGALCVPVLFLLVVEAAGVAGVRDQRSVFAGALFAAFLAAIHWTQIEPSRIARMYSLSALAGGVAAWLLLKALRAGRNVAAWWTAYGSATAASLYVHNFAAFGVIAQACFVAGIVCHALLRRATTQFQSGDVTRSRSPVLGYAGALGLAALLYLPWVPAFLEQASRVQDGFSEGRVSSAEFPRFILGWLFGAGECPHLGRLHSLPDLAMPLAPLLCLACFWVSWRPAMDRMYFFTLAATPWLLTWFVSSVGSTPLFQMRYLTASHFFLLALAGATMASLPRYTEKYVLAAIFGVPCLWATSHHLAEIGSRPPVLQAAVSTLLEEFEEGDVVIVNRPSAVNCVKYYAAQRGANELSVQCYRCNPQWHGHVNHIAALKPADLMLWDFDSPPAHVRRIWLALEVAGGIAMPRNSPWRMDRRHTFSREEFGTGYALELYVRRDEP